MARRPDKRQRLIDAALDVFYRQGFAATPLAQIAEQADVPLGNVYYYFKSKELLLQAVVDRHLEEIEQILREAEDRPTPRERLTSLLQLIAQGAEERAQFGCPVGSLAQELEKQGGSQGTVASRPLELQRQWTRRQFAELGYEERADELAMEFLCNSQGAALVAHALRDPEIMRRRLDHMITVVHSLADAVVVH